ncbi:hypothetical protein OPT61_g8590 [Boeremia exigua]|uniref:Uncharacterized protein n=1 Tax=Boeremia exigua TaxID=749465 RepID=A0ACC2HYT5_9PLEO|nr:hypothetical protein OPT61_g8590 [Boeremia exigua]
MDIHFLMTSAYLVFPGTLIFIFTIWKWPHKPSCCEKPYLDLPPSNPLQRQEICTLNPPTPILPIFVLKAVLESPRVPIYALFLGLTLLSVYRVRRNTASLKALHFRLILGLLSVVRLLSSASGFSEIYDTDWQMLPWDSASPHKVVFLNWIINLRHWNPYYLGRYSNVAPADRKSRPRWSDVVIRLAYYHVVDNAAHVIWLRFFRPTHNGEPFTEYVNNSEILTVILLVLMVAWTGLRVCEQDCASEAEIAMEAGKNQVLVEKLDQEDSATVNEIISLWLGRASKKTSKFPSRRTTISMHPSNRVSRLQRSALPDADMRGGGSDTNEDSSSQSSPNDRADTDYVGPSRTGRIESAPDAQPEKRRRVTRANPAPDPE